MSEMSEIVTVRVGNAGKTGILRNSGRDTCLEPRPAQTPPPLSRWRPQETVRAAPPTYLSFPIMSEAVEDLEDNLEYGDGPSDLEEDAAAAAAVDAGAESAAANEAGAKVRWLAAAERERMVHSKRMPWKYPLAWSTGSL